MVASVVVRCQYVNVALTILTPDHNSCTHACTQRSGMFKEFIDVIAEIEV